MACFLPRWFYPVVRPRLMPRRGEGLSLNGASNPGNRRRLCVRASRVRIADVGGEELARGQWIRQISKSPVDLPLRLDDASASPTTPQGQTSVSIDPGFRRGAGAAGGSIAATGARLVR